MQEPGWTLDELAERVDVALAVDYPGQSSGRVRAVPDRRAIRWYTTIGLIDRPVAHRGRTALYGSRHLLQLVAVKRLQAKGLPLVAIQQELAGATDTQLARVARLPAGPVPAPPPGPDRLAAGRSPGPAPRDGGPAGKGRVEGRAPAAAERVEASQPAAAERVEASQPAAASPSAAAEQPGAVTPRVARGRARRASFWREQPTAFAAASDGGSVAGDPVRPDDAGAAIATLRGVRLEEGATLLLEPGRELDATDLDAILDAARPLLAVLRDRGLGRTAGNADLGPSPRRAGEREPRREHP